MMAEEITMKDIKTALAELAQSQKETGLQLDKLIKENKLRRKEIDKQQKETNKQQKETAKQLKETDKQLKETDKKVKEALNLFTTQWGKLMESLVDGEIVRLLNEKGIEVLRTSTRMKGIYEGKNYEFDIIAHNGDEIVVVEVKTTLKVEDVNTHLDRLKNVKTWMSEYKNHKVIGAVAYLRADEESDTYSESKGLYVIRATGNSASITNKAGFKHRIF